jgi:hypothetical protein
MNDIIAGMAVDLEGLQVAYLGVALAHYLDVETGDILDVSLDEPPPADTDRYRRIPTRTPESEAADRQAFVATVKYAGTREQLAATVDNAMAFRQALSDDLTTQRAFFNFKNDQATKAIAAWLAEEGLE